MKKTKREVGDIYKENGATFKVIGVDGAGRYVLRKVSETEIVETEAPRQRRRTREV